MDNKAKNVKKVTFESLEKIESDAMFPDDSLDLVNHDLWKEENFHFIFHQRRNQFTKDENVLKEEFYKWHNEIGATYFNPQNKQYTIDLLPRKFKLKAANDIAKFINYHPLLTRKDQKNLNLIKKELADKYLRNSVFNTICGTLVIVTVNRRIATKEKKPLSVVIKKNFLLSISLLFISFLFLDYNFRLTKYKFLVNSLNERKMTQKYFENYLKYESSKSCEL